MQFIKCSCATFVFIIFLQVQFHECKRSGGGGRASRPSRPRPAPTQRPYTHAPTSRPYTQATRAPTYRPFPSQAPTFRPQTQRAPTYKPFPTHSPTVRPQPQPGRNPTFRPATQPGRYPTQPSRYPQASINSCLRKNCMQYIYGFTQGLTVVFHGPPPAYPGYGGTGARPPYNQQNNMAYQRPLQIPQPGGKTKVKIYNINNYHPASYSAPFSYPTYHYSSRDTGSGALGFFLGYSLARITSPSYYHCHTCYSGYGPRYDHYTVHHYYHNSGNIPKEQKVTSNNIISCGDSSQICPANTMALCTGSGQIMCVVAVTNTIQCLNDPKLKCVQSTIPCENSEAAECKGVPKGQTATVSIPCISNTVIEGNVTTVNNTIVSKDEQKNTTELTTTQNSTFASLGNNDTFPSLGSNSSHSITKRETAQPYCVTVLAEPSIRKPTEGEIAFNEVTNVFEKFFSKAFQITENQVPDLGS
ncbi:hypothetical protein HHI36_009555 [Cryptolaemus montrouzieri]|uniref:Uncharacterized protein n=1 Tax=Cryptolaemus montrouzieri TaxID=559131 RepID=A0ABD2MGN0_9CUCU